MNPFLIKGYKNPQYFCDRENETENIIRAIKNNQDITLFGYRRLGKSALIQHVFHKIHKDYICIYADLWGTSSIEDFTKELANSIIRSRIFSRHKLSDKLVMFLKSIGASFTFGMDGTPTIDFIYKERNPEFRNLGEIFQFLIDANVPIVFAIDEFQEIKKYENQVPFEARLRTFSQRGSNLVFIYSGSEQHLLNEIFTKYNKPFYQSTRMMSIGKIPEEKYVKFISKHFKKGNKDITTELINHILHVSYRHTYYVQSITNYIYSQEIIPRTTHEFELLFHEFLQEKSVFYSELPDMLTKKQFLFLKSMAKNGIVKNPTSSEFMKQTNIYSSGSIHRIVNSLLEKQIILKEENNLRLYDVFLEHYLKRFT